VDVFGVLKKVKRSNILWENGMRGKSVIAINPRTEFNDVF
jgi:hypothetical protein